MPGPFYMHKQFCRAVHRLTADEQAAVKGTLSDYLANPHLPGLHWHRLDKCRDQGFASIRSSRDIRLILHPCLDGEIVCYVDHHDAAYYWAEQRVLKFDDHTQDVEIYSWPVGEPCQFVAPCRPATCPPLFAKWSDEDLRFYGVPGEWLAEVRKIVSADQVLESLVGQLPEAACEALLSLAEGRRPPRSGSQARDYVRITSVDELEHVLDMSWDEWAVYLHPDQRKIVECDAEGDLVVTGGPGTGKTVVALHRAARLSRTLSHGKVLLLATSPALVSRLRQLLQLLPHEAGSCDLLTFGGLCRRFAGASRRSIISRSELDSLLQEAANEVFKNEVYGLDQLRAEFAAFRDECLISKEEYLRYNRQSCGLRLNRSARLEMYRFLDRVVELLDELNCQTETTLIKSILAGELSNDYAEILVDECQNLTQAEWRLIEKIRSESQCANARIATFGDVDQQVFGIGLTASGTRFDLKVNYRSSKRIAERASRVFGGGTETSYSLYCGCLPVFRQYATVEKETADVADMITKVLATNASLRMKDCAVFVHDASLISRAENILERAKMPYVCFYDGAELGVNPADGVTVATFNQAPGLEYRVVFVIGCEEGVVPPYDLENTDYERRALYVVMTRARDLLVVTGVGILSEFLTETQITAREEAVGSAVLPVRPVRQEVLKESRRSVSDSSSKEEPQPLKRSVLAAGFIKALYHMTAFDNLASLFEHGLLSKHDVERERLQCADISNADVQQRREHKCDTRYGRNLHDYASLYINPRNAMLYYVQRNKPTVCLLEVDLAVLDESTFVFTNANAACGPARFFSDLTDLKELNWPVIFSDRWSGKGLFYKQQMQAEFLVHPKVLPKYIRAVICKKASDSEVVRPFVPDWVTVRCDKTKFFMEV